ncbi:serine/threonine protein kinase [Stieleria sp. TO1_6]|uniref:serine/threonine-protein kinase n=1 Tax=Stieleria tagensis TaxID=2956795 RepID=UPI00209B853A|nr:serine/threonine-protein kinase [Stieleria tagensis]MCO8121548.1 serine/threonine protein kinase [Stieleria tagensis]
MASADTKHDFLDPPTVADGDQQQLGTLGHYRVIRELGKGGMGFVFLAEDTRLKRAVALKVMNQKIAATPGSRKRFISEARSMAAVHHDNVATIFEVGEHKGTPYMAMELLEGATLEDLKDRKEKPEFQELIGYARDIARGLAAAHAQGIVHRDIKPANIWLDTKTNRIKILDFGLALAQTPVDQLSGRGAVVGTPGYLSPEQARSEPLDDRSDLYSAGVVLYELATGALPLKSKTVAEQLIAILVHAPKPLRERNEKIPQPLADLIHRLMAKEPRDRVASAALLESELDRVAVECESKSEMAQAINQLQLGLEQAVKKRDSGDSGVDSIDSGQSPPNPFESLPDVLPTTAALPSPSGVHSLGAAVGPTASATGSSATRSLPGASAAAGRQPSKQTVPAGESSKGLWIAIGVVVALLLALIPAVVYWSTTSAIARQQDGAAVVVSDRNSDSGASQSNNNSPNIAPKAPSKAPAKTPKPKTPSQPAAPAPPADEAEVLVTKVTAKSITDIAPAGATWIVNKDHYNGSFEQTEPAADETVIPGWTMRRSGPDAGWKTTPKSKRPNDKTHAYAGAKSELVVTSETLNHAANEGDVFRVGASIGGEGPGMTDYQVVLGFRDDFGPPLRYQLAAVANNVPWNANRPKRLQYEYTADATVAGKRPFVELTVSNKKRIRKRAMLDDIEVTVEPAAKQSPKSVPGPDRTTEMADAQPRPDSTPMPADPDPIEPAKSNAVAPNSPPISTHQVTVSTAEEGGADATVKRGASSNDPLGEKPVLAIQTRNDSQIQHIYLRFPMESARGEGSGLGNSGQPRNGRNQNNKKTNPLDLASATLKLVYLVADRPSGVVVRVYGLDQPVSDVWPEEKIVWSNSLSTKGLDSLPLLAEQATDSDSATLEISSPKLAEFLSAAKQRTVTLILTAVDGSHLLTFGAKEDSQLEPPTLLLEIKD